MLKKCCKNEHCIVTSTSLTTSRSENMEQFFIRTVFSRRKELHEDDTFSFAAAVFGCGNCVKTRVPPG